MKVLVFFPLVFLTGCVGLYTPIPLRITDAAKYQDDVNFCQAAATNWKPDPSIGEIGYAAADGASGMISYAPINPWIPVLGAVGNAGSTAAAQFNLNGQQKRNVAKHCLQDTTRQDGSAILANPDQ